MFDSPAVELYDELVVGDGGIWQGGNQLISGKIKMLPRPFAAIHYERGEAMAGKSGKWQDLMRRRFDDRQRFLVACMVCGLLCGLLGVVFRLSVRCA